MDKEIQDLDRIVIGVREWSVETVFRLGLGLDRWLAKAGEVPDTKIVLEEATKLEEYVLRDRGEAIWGFEKSRIYYCDKYEERKGLKK